ncbi:ABC transporter substrate-binding protein [Pseudochrobactrum sp. MP213Fo]|uniref:ABC transporter substrate-binding protein n=1 Tax=Pseudochrobactrum sp. MP213Fo TaxID=3022250 RepID=UPI003BA0EA63
MMRASQFLASTSLALSLAFSSFSYTSAYAADPSICVNQYVSATVITDILNGLKEGLKEKNISTDGMSVQNPEADAATQQTLAQGFINGNCDVIVAISTPGAQIFRRLTSDIPVIFVGSSTPVEAGLVESFEKPGTNFTGVADPAPIEADIDAMREVLPAIKAIGLVYKAGDPAGDFLAKRSKEHIEKLGLKVVEATIANAGETTQATQALVGKVDAIHLPGDSTTMSGIAGVLRVANDSKIPVFGSLSEAVSKGSVLSAAYSYTEVGKLASDLVAKVLSGIKPADIPVVVPDASNFEINLTQAKKLGLDIPEDLLRRATRTY